MAGKKSLPLLGQPPNFNSGEESYQHIAEDLLHLDVGAVRFSAHDRTLWATDASAYQVQPIGVVMPNTPEQARRALAYCAAHRLPVLPRGGGTSLAGQCTNHAVVIDFSAGCRRLLAVDLSGETCTVEPGLTIEELNADLAGRGLPRFFAPDPATIAQAAIGGCIGNNAAGARSIRYGRTSENVAGVEVLLSSGERFWLQVGAGRMDPTALRLAQKVAVVVEKNAADIRARFPRLVRRNAGYALDGVLRQLDNNIPIPDLDLSGLICGSEGSLAMVVAARLKLHPRPVASGLAIVAFETLTAAIDAVEPILATAPSAVELLDDVVLQAAGQNTLCRGYVEMLPQWSGRLPQAVLYVEYQSAQGADEVANSLARLQNLLPIQPVKIFTGGPAMAEAWTLRKSSEALLHGVSGYRKPVTFVEDNAVPVAELPRFVREFNRIVHSHGTTAAFYAHASVGVLHVRPLLDLHEAADRQAMRDIAVEIADLARACGGVMSGEHGDGRVRGPLLERFYGEELMAAFRQIKEIFDPVGILNPGMIVNAGSLATLTENLRIGAVRPPVPATSKAVDTLETYFDYHSQESFRGAVEMCNGSGFCRKVSGGSMCPSYRATLDERHSPRGRANALRAALLTDGRNPHLGDAQTLATLDLCLSCKACKSECPSSVDVARLKAEYLAQSYRHWHHVPLAARLFGNIDRLNRWGSRFHQQANALLRWGPAQGIIARILKLSPRRRLPEFSPSIFLELAAMSGGTQARLPVVDAAAGRAQSVDQIQFRNPPQVPYTRPRVIVFADCFTAFNEPQPGLALVRLLKRLGYEVLVPDVGCCGRALMSTGLLAQAKSTIEKTLGALAQAMFKSDAASPAEVRAILFLEPSCLSAVQDDWPNLKLSGDPKLTRAVADKAMAAEDFLDKFWDQHPCPLRVPETSTLPSVVYHGHCHQKALGGSASGTAMLRRVLREKLTVLDSGCCGMAGSFGYTQAHYDLSMKIGELSLFGPVRAAVPDAVIVAPGTSCRHQILDGTGRTAEHPLVLLERLLV